MIEKKVIFVGCARNCAAAIPHVLDNISQMSSLFSETAFIFVENDSVDSTKTDLQAWSQLREDARVISLDGLAAACHIRTIRLETARNRYLSIVRTDYREYDYLFVLDCDDVNAAPLDLDAIRQAIDFIDRDENCAGVFSNSAGTYYDLWALRHPLLCPGDVWEEVFDYSTTHRVTDEEAFNQSFLPRMFSIAADSPPFEVESAFGGLGIYRISNILMNKRHYSGYKLRRVRAEAFGLDGDGEKEIGWQLCEHVSFNSGFRELDKKLFILPYLINYQADKFVFNASSWRGMMFDPRNINKITFDPQVPASWGRIGRNRPCPCGSGKRYKHCHGAYMQEV